MLCILLDALPQKVLASPAHFVDVEDGCGLGQTWVSAAKDG